MASDTRVLHCQHLNRAFCPVLFLTPLLTIKNTFYIHISNILARPHLRITLPLAQISVTVMFVLHIYVLKELYNLSFMSFI